MNKRKIAALLLAAVMVCSLFASPALAAEDAGEPVAISDTKAPKFTDADGHWAESAIVRWAEAGIIEGYGDGTVEPGRSLKRAELATILTRLLGLKKTAPANTFRDVSADAWYADAVLKCAQAGIMLGDGNGRANPETPIDRQQAIVMVGRALGVKPATGHSLNRFDDGDSVADWAKPYMIALTDMGILSGLPTGEGDHAIVAPTVNINRASTFVLLDKAIAQYITVPCTVTVEDANKFVVINSSAEEAGVVTVTGKTAGVVIAIGTTDGVELDKATVGTLKVDAPVDVTISKGSAVTNLDANAAAKVANNGAVTNLNTNADDVTFDGNKPAAVNTAKDVEPAKDSKGQEVTTQPAASTTPSGGSSRPTVVRADIVPANIHDNAANAIADEDLGTVTVTSAKTADKTYDVTITGTNIMNHTNAGSTDGHWVGFGMPAKVNAEGESGSYTYEVGGSVVGSIATRTQVTDGKTYNTVYFSEDTEEAFKDAEYTVVVKDGAETVATYNVTFKVTFYKADVNVSKSLVDPGDEPYFGQFAINTLFPTATQSGYDITLKGEIDPDKLNKDSGENDPKEFTYYGLEVKDEKIEKLCNTKLGDKSASAKWSMAVRIYDSVNKKPLKTSHVYQLKDANDRVQDTITVTVDATGCSIKGMKKVTFVDANGDIVDAFFGGAEDSATAPAVPANTDKVYYTGKWVSGETEVAAGGSVTFTADATYTAQNVEITAQATAVRPAGDPDNFNYLEKYTALGLALKDNELTVNAKTLIGAEAVANEIVKNENGKEYVFYGVEYTKPADATHAVVSYGKTLTGFDDTEKIAVGETDSSDGGTSVYNGHLIDYLPVAYRENGVWNFFEDGATFTRYIKWMKGEEVLSVTKAVTTLKVVPATFTVTFKDEKGNLIEKVEVPYGKADWELRNSVPSSIISTGYYWDGKWYTKDGETYTEYAVTGVLTGDLELIAKVQLVTYTFYTDVNGGTLGYVVKGDDFTIEDKQPVSEGTLKTLPQAHGMKRPGFEFVCWLSEDGKHAFDSSEIISGKPDTVDELIGLAGSGMVNGEKTVKLVAEWKPVAAITALDETAIEEILVDGWANGLKADNMLITLGTATKDDNGVITIPATGALTPYKYAGFGVGADKNQSFVVLAIKKPDFTSAYVGNTDWKVTGVVVRAGIDETAKAYALKVADFTDKLGEGEDAKDYAVIVMLVGNEETTAKTIDLWVDWTGMQGSEVTGTHYVIDLSGVTFNAAATEEP